MISTEHYVDLHSSVGLDVDYVIRKGSFAEANAAIGLEFLVEHQETSYPENIFIEPPFVSGVGAIAVEDPRRCPALVKPTYTNPVTSIIPESHGEMAFYRTRGYSTIQILIAVDISGPDTDSLELAWASIDFSSEGNANILNSNTGTKLKTTGNNYGDLF